MPPYGRTSVIGAPSLANSMRPCNHAMEPMTDPRPNPDPVPGTQPHELEPAEITAPPLPGEVAVAHTVDELIDIAAADLVAHAKACVRQFGDFHLALSGGTTAQWLYERLMYDPDFRQLPWLQTHLWVVADRCVALDDEHSHFRMIKETIIEHTGMPEQQTHPIPALSTTADRDYEAMLREVLEWRPPGEDRLDFVLLQMGPQGDVAGLFSDKRSDDENHRLVRFSVVSGPPPHEWVTMTPRFINAARFIAVLVTGESKASAVRRLATGDSAADEMPIKGIRPINGKMKWYLDADACGAAA